MSADALPDSYSQWDYFRLRGACASVGIEHDMDTDEVLKHYLTHKSWEES